MFEKGENLVLTLAKLIVIKWVILAIKWLKEKKQFNLYLERKIRKDLYEVTLINERKRVNKHIITEMN